MSEQEVQKIENAPVAAQAEVKTDAPVNQNKFEKRNAGRRNNDRRPQQRRRDNDDGFDSRMVKVRRVSRMYHGGRRLRLSVVVVVGDRKGRIGIGSGKGADVSEAQRKATDKAKKNLIFVQLKGNTIPHDSLEKYKASRVLIKPAAPGTGIIAGSTVKAVMDLAGVKDVLTKSLGSSNQINVAYAAFAALKNLRSARL